MLPWQAPSKVVQPRKTKKASGTPVLREGCLRKKGWGRSSGERLRRWWRSISLRATSTSAVIGSAEQRVQGQPVGAIGASGAARPGSAGRASWASGATRRGQCPPSGRPFARRGKGVARTNTAHVCVAAKINFFTPRRGVIPSQKRPASARAAFLCYAFCVDRSTATSRSFSGTSNRRGWKGWKNP